MGGVLFADGAARLLEKFPAAQRPSVHAIVRAPEAMAVRRGQLDEDAFWRWCETRLMPGWTSERFRDAWYVAYTPHEEIFEWGAAIRERISLAIFSGNIESRVLYLERRKPFRHLFDREIWSFDHGATKPEVGFVRALINVLDVSPAQIFYVDDKSAPLRAAADLGVAGFLYRPGETATLVSRFDEFYSRLSEFR